MNIPTDTLVLDTLLIEEWQGDGIDYNQEFCKENRPHKSETTQKDLPWNFPNFQLDGSARMLASIIFFVSISVLLYFLLRHKFQTPPERLTLDPGEDDTIYGVDFAGAIAKAEKEKNWLQAIRLRYLQLLRNLHDSGRIFWLPGKTTTQYVNEAKIPTFATLTRTFVRVRYGNYPSSEELYTEVSAQAQVVEQMLATQSTNEGKEIAQ